MKYFLCYGVLFDVVAYFLMLWHILLFYGELVDVMVYFFDIIKCF